MSKRGRYWFWGVLLGFFIWSGCQEEAADEEVVINIDPEFVITPVETLGDDPHTFGLKIQTVNPQSCTNTKILYQAHQSPDTHWVNIRQLLPPAQCIEGNEIVSTEASIGSLNVGEHVLQVVLGGTIINEGRLMISPTDYRLEMFDAHGLIPFEETILRIPEGLIWGQFTSFSPDDRNLLNSLVAEFDTLVTPFSLPPGNYHHFQVKTDGELQIAPKESTAVTLGFYGVGAIEDVLLWKDQILLQQAADDDWQLVLFSRLGPL